ncbi:MAG: hypothetical protein ACXAE3_08735 [Candidatus Kariarchaeaceae archaeon]
MENSQFINIPEGEHDHADYIPGVCNIGPEEIKKRKLAFNVSLVGVVGVAIAYLLIPLNQFTTILGLAVLFATGAGSGVSYLQVREKFCVAYGSIGVFNFQDLGNHDKVADTVAKKADRDKVRKMFLQAALLGIIYTAIVYFLSLLI